MQGGVISAAIDNVIGPLSLLIAPPNVTRKAEVKYLKGIDANIDFIYVTTTFIKQKKNFLYFEARVENEDQTIKYATANFMNWII